MRIAADLVQGDLRPLLDDVVVLNIPTINPGVRSCGQRVPIYRLMKQTSFPALVVEPPGSGVKNQIYR